MDVDASSTSKNNSNNHPSANSSHSKQASTNIATSLLLNHFLQHELFIMRGVRRLVLSCWILQYSDRSLAFQNSPWMRTSHRSPGSDAVFRQTRLQSATTLVSQPLEDEEESLARIKAAKEEVLRLSTNFQEDFGVVVLNEHAQVELKDAISALEVCCSSKQSVDEEDSEKNEVELNDDWTLVCSTAQTPVESLSSILPRAMRSNVLRLSNKYTFHQLKVSNEKVQHIYQMDQPNQLNDVFPNINQAIRINPFQVNYSQLVLEYCNKSSQPNELTLDRILWKVATSRSTRTVANIRVPSRLAPKLSLETVYQDSDLFISRSNLLNQLLVFVNTTKQRRKASLLKVGTLDENDMETEYMEEIRDSAVESSVLSPEGDKGDESLVESDGEMTFAEEMKSKAQLIVDAFRRKTNVTTSAVNPLPLQLTSIHDMIPVANFSNDGEHAVPESVYELEGEIARALNWTGDVRADKNSTAAVSVSDSVSKVAKKAVGHVLSTWSDLLGKHQNGLEAAEKSAADVLFTDKGNEGSNKDGVQYFVWKSLDKIPSNTSKAISDAFFLETLNETLQVESSNQSDEKVTKDVLTSWMDELMPKYSNDEMEAIEELEKEIAEALSTAEEALKVSSEVSYQRNATLTEEGTSTNN